MSEIEVKIPMVVTDDGRIASIYHRKEDGTEERVDVGLLYDDVYFTKDGEENERPTRLVYVSAKLDLDELFKQQNIEGSVEVESNGICEYCGSKGDDVTWRPDPFDAAINHDHTHHWICHDCWFQHSAEV